MPEEICQECGRRVEVEREYPTGYICDNCLDAAREERTDKESCF